MRRVQVNMIEGKMLVEFDSPDRDTLEKWLATKGFTRRVLRVEFEARAADRAGLGAQTAGQPSLERVGARIAAVAIARLPLAALLCRGEWRSATWSPLGNVRSKFIPRGGISHD